MPASLPGGGPKRPRRPTAETRWIFRLVAGEDLLYADFGFEPTATTDLGTIGNIVFLDLDGDGVQDPGENGISSVTLQLLDSSGNPIAVTETDADGGYDFSGLPAGDYQVEVVDSNNVLRGLNLTVGSNPTTTITLAAGQGLQQRATFPTRPQVDSGRSATWSGMTSTTTETSTAVSFRSRE